MYIIYNKVIAGSCKCLVNLDGWLVNQLPFKLLYVWYAINENKQIQHFSLKSISIYFAMCCVKLEAWDHANVQVSNVVWVCFYWFIYHLYILKGFNILQMHSLTLYISPCQTTDCISKRPCISTMYYMLTVIYEWPQQVM